MLYCIHFSNVTIKVLVDKWFEAENIFVHVCVWLKGNIYGLFV